MIKYIEPEHCWLCHKKLVKRRGKKIGGQIYYKDNEYAFCKHGHFSAHKKASFIKPDDIFYYEVKYKTSIFNIKQYINLMDYRFNNNLDMINLSVKSFDCKIDENFLIHKLCYYDNNMIENLLILK